MKPRYKINTIFVMILIFCLVSGSIVTADQKSPRTNYGLLKYDTIEEAKTALIREENIVEVIREMDKEFSRFEIGNGSQEYAKNMESSPVYKYNEVVSTLSGSQLESKGLYKTESMVRVKEGIVIINGLAINKLLDRIVEVKSIELSGDYRSSILLIIAIAISVAVHFLINPIKRFEKRMRKKYKYLAENNKLKVYEDEQLDEVETK